MPFNLLAAFVCAELSYRVIELPALKARDRLAARLGISAKKTVQSGEQDGGPKATEERQMELVGSGK
jgi:peptidoglycan/LPS O-acetylase OafA/YrhL